MSKKAVALISDMVLRNIMERILKDRYNTVAFSNIQSSLDYIYNSLPNLIILDTSLAEPSVIRILNNLKEDPIFNQVPVLAVVADTFSPSHWDSMLAEDYVRKSEMERELLLRVDLSLVRSERVVEINPLTRLPGNISINRQIQASIDRQETFALAYADLDNFKPFNDHYGFTRGDEVIKMTGRLILNTVKNRQPKGSFVGHIGGDDFIFVMDTELVEETAQEIIDAFDRIIPTFYDEPDKEKGVIESSDRHGNLRTFSFIGLSIGISSNRFRAFSHYGQLTEAVSEMKHFAKNFKGSCVRSDKRRG
jgi:diguanylate cyclase (GGDEF)-like protein